MKSERGQARESTLLADKIEQQFVRIRPYLPALLGMIVAGVLVMIGYGVYSSQRESRSARAWTDFYFSDTQLQDLEAISKDYEDTSASSWARLVAADRGMAQALDKWNIDRSIADQRFQEAVDDYRDAARVASDSFLKSRALFGLGQALEGLGKRTEAIDAYRQINTLTGLAPEYLNETKSRIQWLEGKEGESFYAWYNGNRSTSPTPAGSGELPGLPSLPNITFPPISGGTSGGVVPSTPAPAGDATIPVPSPTDSPSQDKP